MLHAEQLLNLLACKAAGAFADRLKHLLAHGVELIAHAVGCIPTGVDAVMRCRRIVKKWQVAGVHKKKAPKGLVSGQERREVDRQRFLVVLGEVADVVLPVIVETIQVFGGFLGGH